MTTRTNGQQEGGESFALAQALRSSLRGEVSTPGDGTYEERRRVYNANIDRRPRMIATCRDVTDVIEAVNFARDHDMQVAIRGGGHNIAGLGTCDDGLLIDLSAMRGTRLDPRRRRVFAQGGCQLGDLDHTTHACGLAVPAGIVSTTGVAGLTLGGGFGHLSRQYGLTCDNLCSADVVTAEGKLIVADEDHHPDLFWALKGGGGNFGVVTSFEFQAHPAGTVVGGPMFWPLAAAQDLFELYHDYIQSAPESLGAYIAYHMIPPTEDFPTQHHLETMCGIVFCYNGPQSEVDEVFEPIRSALPPALDLVEPMPYIQLQQMFDPLLPPGLHHYWKTLFLRELPEEAIDVHLEYGARAPNFQSGMHMYPLNGAVHRIGPRETAFNHRDVQYAVNIFGIASNAEQLGPIRQWVREYFDALEPHSSGTGYINFLMGDEKEQMERATFGDNYDRLVNVKNQYDPDNLFRFNHNIEPTTPRAGK